MNQQWVERLGWTLVHFLWQGLSIAILYAVARRSVSRPNARYLLACAALSAMMAAPLLTWGLMRPSDPAPYRIRNAPPAVAPTAAPRTVLATMSFVQQEQFLPWVVTIWFAGAIVFWVRLAGGWVVAARLRSIRVRRAPPEWQDAMGKLGARIGISRPMRLLVSALVQAPTVVGWLRPVVLVPVGALGGLPPGHLESLLLHELAHIRRHDYLVNILQSVVEALLFYHPAVWWVSGHMRAERELCCDDVAVSVSGDALAYARVLEQLESHRQSAALAANGGSLSKRIARLLGQSHPDVRPNLGPGVLAITVLLAAAAYGLFGQSGSHPAFQAVSIKQNTSNWNERFRHPMGLGVNSSLMLMIQFAYAPHDNPMTGHSLPLLASQVVGGPPWINTIGYDIEVKPESNSDPKRKWLMWQTLLADRFKLRLHRETRELPIYNLTVVTSGPKLSPAQAAGCVSFPPGTTPREVPGKVDCGYVAGPMSDWSKVQRLEGRKIHMADLVRQLASVLDRPVLDKTGFTAEFDLALSFTNIFTALEEQLGLRLVPAKGPVEVLVIDHAEKPGG